MIRSGVAVLLVLLLGVAMLWGLQRTLIYFPDDEVPPVAAVLGPGAREVALSTEDGLTLGAWLVTPTGADRRVGVVVLPGNAGNRAYRAPLARRLAAEGFTVLLVDYRGYGGNPGSPSEDGLARDARAARNVMLAEARIAPERLLYFGESLGAAVATRLAAEQGAAGLVLRSPFTDLAAVGSRHYPFLPVRALLRDRYPVLERIGQVRSPTVVVYGDADRIVPPEHSEAVATAAPALVRSVVVPGAGHNDEVLLAGDELVSALRELADRL